MVYFKIELRSSFNSVPTKNTIVCKSLLKRISAINPDTIARGERLTTAISLPNQSPLGYSTRVKLKGTHSTRFVSGSLFSLSSEAAMFPVAEHWECLGGPVSNMSAPRAHVNRRPLVFKILQRCPSSRARTSNMRLPHREVPTPVFMPVGTQGTLKGLLPDQLEALGCDIILGNTYHLGTRPGADLLRKAGGLHKFMGWNRALLTDSGGFQMVSLLKLAKITEEGVKFKSPYNDSECLLTPEKSMEIQNAIGADIIMQLDDVVSALTTGPRVEEAMSRTARWLDRCLAAHKKPTEQSVFPIVQGGLDLKLREECVQQLTQRDVNGFAIGGLSGGEAKDEFWRMVDICCQLLPEDKPRYCMGVGFAADLVVCVALGVDMFDCVFPTRTARFGCGLVDTGQINLKHKRYTNDFTPLQEDCNCSTCRHYTRAYIHSIASSETVACHLLSVHNISYQLRLMQSMRQSITDGKFPEFVKNFMAKMFPERDVPKWIVEALSAVNINI